MFLLIAVFLISTQEVVKLGKKSEILALYAVCGGLGLTLRIFIGG